MRFLCRRQHVRRRLTSSCSPPLLLELGLRCLSVVCFRPTDHRAATSCALGCGFLIFLAHHLYHHTAAARGQLPISVGTRSPPPPSPTATANFFSGRPPWQRGSRPPLQQVHNSLHEVTTVPTPHAQAVPAIWGVKP